MQQSGLAPSLEILQVNQDDVGPYIRIRVTIADEEIDIRWGLDEFTYVHLSKLLKALFPKHFPGEQYKCFLSFDAQSVPNSAFTGWVVCQLGSQTTRLSFECSELYQSNLEWLRNVEDAADLEDLSWNHWIDAYSFDDSNEDFETLKTLLAEPRTHRRKVLVPVIILVALCVVGASLWFGLTRLHRGALKPAQSPSSKAVAVTQAKTIAGNANQPLTVTTDAKTASSTSGLEIYHLPAGEVALTFDDGPNEYTQQILDTLANNHIHATFFFIANNVTQYPDVAREAAIDGNEVEDHSVDHHNLQGMPEDKQNWEINQAAKTIEQYTDEPVTMFRPPYEAFDKNTKQLLSQDGMALALYNEDPEDWKATSVDEVTQKVLSLPASGSIFDLHDRKFTAEALPGIIHALEAKHLKFVVLQDPRVQT